MISWDEFLNHSPRKAILLYTLIRYVSQPLNVTYGEDDINKYKPNNNERIQKEGMLWLKRNFDIVRVVTFIRSARARRAITLEEYKHYVFGDFNPNQVTLIIVNWIGIDVKTQRIEIKSAPPSFAKAVHVRFESPVQPELSASPKVLNAYKAYVSKYIGNRKYIGIVFRAHTVLRYSPKHGSFNQASEYLLECSKNLSHVRSESIGGYSWPLI